MKQIIQDLKSGQTILENVPKPLIRDGCVIIKTSKSLVSLGTERMLVEFAKSNLLDKARQQPDKVKQVLSKVKTDGLMPTFQAVMNKLDSPLPLGYCNVGKVVEIGKGVENFQLGDRVASNGCHAEYVCIPKNLVSKIPENVTDYDACFTVIGSIGLQAIRLSNPTFGETVVVFGLGLIGLITCQLLIANGCKVIGIDLDESKLKLARTYGVITLNSSPGSDPVRGVLENSEEIGADAVIITASVKTNTLISQAANMCRKRGRIILLGVIGLDIQRSDFYEKELSFQVSCSYGPGRYDTSYESDGIDYPLPFVRWTENRNFKAILNAIASQKLNLSQLITQKVNLDNFGDVYNNISKQSGNIASILEYSPQVNDSKTVEINNDKFKPGNVSVGIIGAGNFTQMTVLPILKKLSTNLISIASLNGLSGTNLAKKYKIRKSTSDYLEILRDSSINLVMITLRHNLHATVILESLQYNKNIFVEKPLCLNKGELDQIVRQYSMCSNTIITVGFNRRFSPHSEKIKSLIGSGLMNIVATVNAGYIPPNSWVHDMQVGGGRIIGEACHFIDLITYFTGSRVIEVCCNGLGVNIADDTDNVTINLKYENGSLGTINYFSNGSKSYPKERVEIYSQGRTAVIDNFRITYGFGFKSFTKLKTSIDKGHINQFKKLFDKIEHGGDALIPFDEIINTTKASIAAIESLKLKEWIRIN